MAKKLFALEDAELEGMGSEVELETAPEEGEVADAQLEVQEDSTELENIEVGVDEGMDAADQLEEVHDVVEQAVEGEGLDPVAAEAIRIAVEAICARVGANPKAVYSLYATENFQSASSRKANTRIALEGIGEFLKDLWKKIKAALMKLWEKVKAFWDKHISSLGRIRKAVDSMREKVAESSGKFKDKTYVDEAPSSLSSAFPAKDDISYSLVKTYIHNHRSAHNPIERFDEAVINGVVSMDITAPNLEQFLNSIKAHTTVTIGTQANPLVGGKYTTITVKFEAEDGDLDIDVDKDTIDEVGEKQGVILADKKGLQEVLKECSDLVKELERFKTKQDKILSDINKGLTKVDRGISKLQEDGILQKEQAKPIRNALKVAYKLQAKAMSMGPEVFAADIQAVKAALSYVAFTLKHYKSVA